MRSSWAQPR